MYVCMYVWFIVSRKIKFLVLKAPNLWNLTIRLCFKANTHNGTVWAVGGDVTQSGQGAGQPQGVPMTQHAYSNAAMTGDVVSPPSYPNAPSSTPQYNGQTCCVYYR